MQRDDHGRFRPGEVFVGFAWRGGAEAGLAELAQPFLERLGEQTGETINLGVAAAMAWSSRSPRWTACT